jgi:hypothetical protein
MRFVILNLLLGVLKMINQKKVPPYYCFVLHESYGSGSVRQIKYESGDPTKTICGNWKNMSSITVGSI